MSALLEIAGLNVHFATPDGDVHAVKDAGLSIHEGECLGVVGESGLGQEPDCSWRLMGLLAQQRPRRRQRRSIRGEELLGASKPRRAERACAAAPR
jgi:ABC-type microcin C transport system duplicated ATPase subunit YejF